jgi:hypothetical protein
VRPFQVSGGRFSRGKIVLAFMEGIFFVIEGTVLFLSLSEKIFSDGL